MVRISSRPLSKGLLFFVLFSFLFLFLALLLYLFRDTLVLWAFQKTLRDAGLNFSCKALTVKDGHFYFRGLYLGDPAFELWAEEGAIYPSFKEKGVLLFLKNFEGRYDLLFPARGLTPPKYLLALQLENGKLLLEGKPSYQVRLKRLKITGLKAFFGAFKAKEALAFIDENPKTPKTPPLPKEKDEFSGAVKLDVKVDLAHLPHWLKKDLFASKGVLKLELFLDPKDEGVYFKGRASLTDLSLDFPELNFSLAGEGSFSGFWQREKGSFWARGRALFEPPVSLTYRLEGKLLPEALALERLKLSLAAGPPFFASLANSLGAKIKGELSGSAEIFPQNERFQAELVLRQGGFALSEDRVGEGIDLEAKIRGGLSKNLSLKGEVLLKRGEFFWAPWYYALERPLRLSFNLLKKGRSLFVSSLKVNGPFTAEVEGLEVYPQWSWPHKAALKLKMEDFWGPLVAEPFGEEYPFLSRTKLSGSLFLRQQKGVINAYFSGRLGFGPHQFEGLRLAGAYDLSGSCKDFSLSWAEVKSPVLLLGPLELEGKTCPPKLFLEPFSWSLFRGNLESSGGAGDIGQKTFFLKETELKGLRPDLPPPWKSLSPEISGHFTRVTFAKGRLEGKGLLKVRLAGGELIIKDFFFEPGVLPRYGGDITFSGLDLTLLSKALGFGLITGRLRGKVRHLVMVGKLPASFELWLEDDPSYRGKRRISLKAVRQMAELGGGRATLLVPFAKSLRYQRLGLYCRLENDVFYLKGLIKEGGKEYLVKGPKLFGVDVINQNPGGAISFKEMVRRLKRVMEESDEKEPS